MPDIKLDNSLPEPADIVHPSDPCPVFKYKLLKGVVPIIGVLSGVLGLKPVQKSKSFVYSYDLGNSLSMPCFSDSSDFALKSLLKSVK